MEFSRRVPKENRWLRLAASSTSTEPVRLDDDSLIDAVVRGDSRHASELHDRLIKIVDHTLYRLFGGREHDHDDLVQTTFEQIVITLMRGGFARQCSLSTWASTVAAHVAFKALRSRRRERNVFEAAWEVDPHEHRGLSGDAERDMTAREQVHLAQRHLTAMDQDKAMVVALHDIMGHDLAEIASMLDISPSAAQSRLVRGRREFLRRMGKTETATRKRLP